MSQLKEDSDKDYTHLENKLLEISEEIIQYRRLHYNDDVIGTLIDLYCLKEIEPAEAEGLARDGVKTASSVRERFAFLLKKLGSLPHRSRGRERTFRGIDGNIYRESELKSWKHVKKLINSLRKRINNDRFDPGW
ncbi:hypothetical protein [Halarsenatibacter silvermanii]|uniref:Uncharacterized protein n=1 Tax=Halarsenatibacter silvermanii TaxID=321763 RepID=A0A1G9I5M2_9FIRM|nr:hypothetical protein [Halarsenatibacter silvermanii]SDL20376.1 hypothetical protein SAMN04488692_102119 [Halarsenatibacter silvermanii]